MYIVVEHQISDPAKFWPGDVSEYARVVPPHLKQLQTLAATDGTRAVCVWEAASVDALRDWLDPYTEHTSRNSYFQAVNKEGIATPSGQTVRQQRA